MASAVILWSNVDSSTTLSEHHTNNTALGLLPGPSREETAAPVLPRSSGPFNSIADDRKHAHKNNEERARLPLSSLPTIRAKVQTAITSWQFRDLKLFFEQFAGCSGTLNRHEVLLVLGYADALRHQGTLVSDKAILALLVPRTGITRLAELFDIIRGLPTMKNRVDNLQKALAEMRAENTPMMIEEWLELGISPDIVYRLLSIGTTKRFTPGGRKGTWSDIYRNLEIWFTYTELYRFRYGVYGDDAILQVLVENRGLRETIAFLYYLRCNTSLEEFEKRADSLLRLLAETNANAQERMIELWLMSKASPDKVYRMLPIGGASKSVSRNGAQALFDIFCKLRDWVKYVVAVRALQANYADEAIVKLLVKNRGEEEAKAFLIWLRHDNDMEDFADSLLLMLAVTYPKVKPAM